MLQVSFSQTAFCISCSSYLITSISRVRYCVLALLVVARNDQGQLGFRIYEGDKFTLLGTSARSSEIPFLTLLVWYSYSCTVLVKHGLTSRAHQHMTAIYAGGFGLCLHPISYCRSVCLTSFVLFNSFFGLSGELSINKRYTSPLHQVLNEPGAKLFGYHVT